MVAYDFKASYSHANLAFSISSHWISFL